MPHHQLQAQTDVAKYLPVALGLNDFVTFAHASTAIDRIKWLHSCGIIANFALGTIFY